MAPKKDKKGKKEPKKEKASPKAPKEEKKAEPTATPGPDPASVDFEAGLLFNKADISRSGVLTADDFRKLWRDTKMSAAPPAGANGVGPEGATNPPSHLGPGLDPAALSFEAGKIFASFDTDHDGRLDKTDFENMIKNHPEFTRGVPGVASLEAAKNNPMGTLPTEVGTGRLLTHFDETAGVAIPRSALEQHRKLGNTVTPLLESYRARYDRLRGMLTSRLLPKREHLLQLRRQLTNSSAEVAATKGAIERETLTDGEQIIERLRTVESMRQSAIKHQQLKLETELETIERIVRRVEQANEDGLYNSATGVLLTSTAPGTTPVETVRAPRAASMVELIQQFADLSAQIDKLSTQNVEIQVEFPTDDFPKETQERLEVLARCDKYMHALSVKDHMLWNEIQEKEKTQDLLAEERKLSHEYAQEVASWADMAQGLTAQNSTLKGEKEKLERRNRDLVAKLREHNIYYDVPNISPRE